jgi:hypothetical protein
VFQLVLPLHECADPAAARSAAGESAAEPLHSIAESAAAEPLRYVANSIAVESAAEPLQSVADFVADSAATSAALTETS